MIDLKDYVPEELKFKLPTTVKFPEVFSLIVYLWTM